MEGGEGGGGGQKNNTHKLQGTVLTCELRNCFKMHLTLAQLF